MDKPLVETPSQPLMTLETAGIPPKWKFLLIFLLPFVLAGSLFFTGLGSLPLLEPDEGRNAEVAREMLVTGDWITPHYNLFPYLDKPAVYFWMVASSFKVAGFSEWAARLPSALMGLCLLLLLSYLARKMFSDATALRAAVIVATAPLVMAFSRLVIFDMTLTFLITVAMSCFWFAEVTEFQRRWPDALMFLAMGLATITKGPVGLLLPLLSIMAYAALSGRFRELKRLRWGLGCAVFLAAALPWFISVSIRYPDFPQYALLKESLGRFSGGLAHRKGNPFYYIPVYLAGFFPWSIFLLLAGWNRHRRWREIRASQNRPTLFLMTWAIVTFLFFSFSQSKLPGYFLPAIVPLGILMAKGWEEVGSRLSQPPDWLTAGFAFLLGMGLIIAASSQLALFGSEHSQLTKTTHPVFFAMLKPSILYSGVILASIALVGRNISSRMRGIMLSTAALILLALTTPVLLIRWLPPLAAYAETHSSRQLAGALRASPEGNLPIYGYYYFRTSLPFYLQRPVGLVTSAGSELTSNYLVSRIQRLQQQASGPAGSKESPWTFQDIDPAPPGERRLLNTKELIELSRSSSQPRLVMVRNTHVNMLARDVSSIEPLWTGWNYSVWEIPGKESAVSPAVPFKAAKSIMP